MPSGSWSSRCCLRPRRDAFAIPVASPQENRAALTGILFILKTGLPWNDLPREMGCGSGAACWVRLHEWHQRGVWKEWHTLLLAKLRHADQLDRSRAAVDSTTLRALRGGDKTGKTPADRGRKGTRDHLLTAGNGVPLAAHATAADRHGGQPPRCHPTQGARRRGAPGGG